MARMKYVTKKTGWAVPSTPQPRFRGVYPRCSLCHRRLREEDRITWADGSSGLHCPVCFHSPTPRSSD